MPFIIDELNPKEKTMTQNAQPNRRTRRLLERGLPMIEAFTSERIYWAVEQVEREAGDINNLHLDDNLFYIQSDADEAIATIQAERDAYKDERDRLQAELDGLTEDYSVKTAAAALLENYSSWRPSAGEVDGLAEGITQLLTEKYHISRGII